MSNKYILAIDQGTSSTKSLIFDEKGQAVAKGSENLHAHYFGDGFVEQEPEVIYQNVLASVAKCLEDLTSKGLDAAAIAGIGISNQRETFIVWDKAGKPLHNAVVWQCKRSVQICEELKQQGLSEQVNQKTGLVIDPYFSATKLIWLNRNNEAVKNAIANGEAYFGTVDTWLLYKMTNGKNYATDYTNASRTLLFNLHTLQWDEELIEAFGLTGIQLPEVKSSSASFGKTTLDGLFAQPVPVAAMIGDSHAAAFGEGCFEAGTAKATLGTGCSILMNIGDKPVQSNNGMVTTICWSIDGRIDYALEGVIVSCGATIEWLKNELGLFNDSKETEAMATAVADNGGVYLIPAFSGLGSPHWQMDRKASIEGISFGSTKNHIVRAALESIPYQIKDVVTAMQSDATVDLKSVNINGGISGNRFVMQMIADLLQINITRSAVADASALGAAFLAGLATGLYKDLSALKERIAVDQIYQPASESTIVVSYKQWQQAIYDYKRLM
ncbi:MAG: glycerol kinase GlpK [Chitinophagaceae bacterium]|nr:glycerol kinase GlpK [Chitinophagaceae bacterium]